MKNNRKKIITLLTIIGFLFVIVGTTFGVIDFKLIGKNIKTNNSEKDAGPTSWSVTGAFTEDTNTAVLTQISTGNSYSRNINDSGADIRVTKGVSVTVTRTNGVGRYWIFYQDNDSPNTHGITASIDGNNMPLRNKSNYETATNNTYWEKKKGGYTTVVISTSNADTDTSAWAKLTSMIPKEPVLVFDWAARESSRTLFLRVVAPFYVSYDANGGSGTAATKQLSYYNGQYTTLSNSSTRTGYTFVSWNTKADGSGTSINAGNKYSVPSNDSILYAQWRKNNYTISFNTNGANQNVSNVNTSYDTNVTIPNTTLTKDGYIFKGYATEQNGTVKYQPGDTVKNLTSSDGATVTLYAVWEKAPTTTYTVTFNANGGTGSMSDSTFTHMKNATLPANGFSKRGYDFNGWNTKADGTGTTYQNGGTINQATSVDALTLYAQWKVKEYTLSYNLNGGTAEGPLPEKYTVETGDITLPDVSKKGYTFLGWTGPDVSTPTKGLVIPSGSVDSKDFVAVFEVKQFSIDLTKGPGISSVTGGGTYNYGDQVTLKATLEEGYEFDGWYDADGQKVSSDINYTFTMSDKPINLTAKGKVAVYDVNYKDEDGTNKKLELEYNTKVTTVVDGQKTEYVIKQDTTIPNPTKTGYHFTGWTDTKKGDDHILISNFDINHYTINVNVENGRTDGQSLYDVVHGDDQVIRVIPNDGYAFDTILIDGEPVSMTNNEYEFKNIDKSHNVVVTFSEDSDGSGIPDKYEVNVTFKIVNGTWKKTNLDENLVIPYAIYEQKNGVWERITKVTLGTLPEIIPNENYKLGNWDPEIDEQTEVTANATYTHTCVREYKFIKQPSINDEKSNKDNYVVDWKTNFDPVKVEIIDPNTGDVIEILEDPTKEEIEKKINKLKDEKIIIRSYYDDDNYVDSSEITLKHIDTSKNPKTNDNMPIYIGAAISSLLGLSIIGLYIKKNKNSI